MYPDCKRLLFVVLLFLMSSCSAITVPSLTTDQQSLLVLKDHITSDPFDILHKNWSTTTPTSICNWIGVSCGLKHRVTALDLSYMDLSGTIPLDIGNLTFLTSLDLTSNRFHGIIPKEMSGLRRLEKIYLESNYFTGVVPSWFESLPKLREISLNNNSLSGIIPVSLCNIQKLEVLSLAYNYLNGHLPEELGNLSKLGSLDLKYNQLTGSMPYGIFNLSALKTVDLTGNGISGTLPLDMCDRLPKLEALYISQNQFFGQIPSTMYKCQTLQYLSLSNNGFNGSIPREIGNLTTLRLLSLGENPYEGSIPREIGNLINLEKLSLRNASLTGVIPSSIFNISSLRIIDFSINSLTGSLPYTDDFKLPLLEVLLLSFNKLTGKIPSSMGNFQCLQQLDLKHNMFTGRIPLEIGNLTLLKLLVLDSNNLTGSIPDEIGDLGLKTLTIHENGLTGLIPFGIYNMTTLKMLDLRQNSISGSLPSRLFLPNLEELHLRSNKLSGTIPSSISNASKLTTLSLSINSFTGSIPNAIGNLRLLRYLLLAENNLTRETSSMELNFISSLTNCQDLKLLSISLNQLNGVLPKSIGNLSTSLTRIEAFGCKLKGEIPFEIGSLIGLEALILDSNDFTGQIPPSIQSLDKLARLYLEHNKLQGSIPNELCQLKNLGDLYLSDNKLYGSIPVCLGDLGFLQRLYLDSNNLNSTIPASLWSLTNLIGLNLSSNMLIGYIPKKIQNFKEITELGLSWNQLSGYLPSTIGEAQMLVYLSVTHNKLQGPLPQTLGNLINLEFLDLSSNNLSGVIPKSLEALRYLKYFNVSFNSLQGKIPTGGMFSNLTVQSYIENDGLCGIPSIQVCMNEASRKSRSQYVRKLIYTLPSVAIATLALILMFVLIKRRRRNIRLVSHFDPLPSAFRRFTYLELVQATNSFSESNLIGKGGMGLVYKGILPDGVTVAVKVFNLHSDGALKCFNVECNIMGSIRHRNLTKIISSCTNLTFRALILEYMPNGSLENWLYSQNNCLDILQLINIMIDVASALEYLHYGLTTTIVHSDLKPSNVLLDADMVAHVCDFGISQLLGEEEHIIQTSTLGTIGYMAPEYGSEGIVSAEADVYSFGILLLETFTRKRPTDKMFSAELSLRSWVDKSLQGSILEVIDTNLTETSDEITSAELQCISSVFGLAMYCSTNAPSERINIAEAVDRLHKIRNKFVTDIEMVRNL